MTPGDMQAKTLVDALTYALGEEKAERQDDTQGYIEAETFVEALASTLTNDLGRESKPTHANVKGEGLIEVLARHGRWSRDEGTKQYTV